MSDPTNTRQDELLRELDLLIETQAKLMFQRDNYDEAAATVYGIALLDFMRVHGVTLRAAVAELNTRSGDSGMGNGWLDIASAPDDLGLCVVYTPDLGDGERYDFDWKEDDCWMKHANHYEHYMMVGGSGAAGPDTVCIGPNDKPAYTHYRPLTPPTTAASQGGEDVQS